MVRHTGEDFVDVESVAVASVLAFQSACINRSELDAPEADRFSGYGNAWLGQEVFDIPMTEIESIVEPNGVGNDIGWESVAFVCIYSLILAISVSLLVSTISSDNDPLFQYHRWKANLRVLEIEEIKSIPHVPISHPFVERLIGSIRRELLDQTFFWTATDLENKLRDYQCYFNECRTHSGRYGSTPVANSGRKVADINQYQWQRHCRGLFELPIAA